MQHKKLDPVIDGAQEGFIFLSVYLTGSGSDVLFASSFISGRKQKERPLASCVFARQIQQMKNQNS